jgi:hypothetical protein
LVPTLVLTEGPLRLTAERNVLVGAWRDAPTVPALRALERAGQDWAKKYPAGTALLNLALSGTPNFSSEVRTETSRVSARPDIFVLATAHVVLVSGLVGAAIRAFLSTSLLLAKSTRPTKVFGDKAIASDWVKTQLAPSGETWTRAELVALIDQG